MLRTLLVAAVLAAPVGARAEEFRGIVASGEVWTGFPFPTSHEHLLVGPALDVVGHQFEGYLRIGFGMGGYLLRGEGDFALVEGGPQTTETERIYGGRVFMNATSTGYGHGFGVRVDAGLSPLYAEIGELHDWVLGFHARAGLGGTLGPVLWGVQVGVLSATLATPAVNVGGLTGTVSLGWNFAHTGSDDGDGDFDGGSPSAPGLELEVPRRVPVPPGGVTLLIRATTNGNVSTPAVVTVRASEGVRWELYPPRDADPAAWELRVDSVPADGGTVDVRATAGDLRRSAQIELYRGFGE